MSTASPRKVRLLRISSDDDRLLEQLEKGETIEHEVVLDVDGAMRTDRVFLRANLTDAFDASLLWGDGPLEDLLRFHVGALQGLYRAVGRFRRGEAPSLPLLVLDVDDSMDAHVGTPGQ